MRTILRFIFSIALLLVCLFALLPATSPVPTTGWDKSNHALAFAFLAYLGSFCWPSVIARVLIALAAYGGAIEIAQATLTTTRIGEWSDWFADIVGLLIVAAYVAWQRRGAEPRGK